ncbi:Oidioi.mRNA.OKI2018_I69.chr2.g5635.t1.cds [Oikopleura dioica]|uniref:Oidioi.mRNA.OKI2018_I69.chr2.g5635.t1.cds n=1 Tax=Oikopleura dioica TaxID=34765 RepID=A0ABN7T462_OIKDI|nr:Oidioi.mRNA.OKI2018_I69.chr2.g5635.t1.cds [Oikopleura dioica]
MLFNTLFLAVSVSFVACDGISHQRYMNNANNHIQTGIDYQMGRRTNPNMGYFGNDQARLVYTQPNPRSRFGAARSSLRNRMKSHYRNRMY